MFIIDNVEDGIVLFTYLILQFNFIFTVSKASGFLPVNLQISYIKFKYAACKSLYIHILVLYFSSFSNLY